DDGGAPCLLGLSRPARGGARLERVERASEERDRLFAGEVRHLLHAHPPQSGGGAGPCLPRRLGPSEPRRDGDGPGPASQDQPGRGVPVRGAAGAGPHLGHGHDQGAEHLGHGRLLGRGPERDGHAERLRRDPRPHGRASGRASPDHARPGRVPRWHGPCRWRAAHLGWGGGGLLSCPRVADLHGALRDARPRMGPRPGQGAAVLLLLLRLRGDGGRGRYPDGREPHPAGRHPARLRQLAEPGPRCRADRGGLRPGRGVAHDGGAGLGCQGASADPRALHLQDPCDLGSTCGVQRGSLACREPGRDGLSQQGRGRAAPDAGHLGVPRASGRLHGLRAALAGPSCARDAGAGAEGDPPRTGFCGV
ncbi:MAG: Xanthine dehydrogenase, molybdenum binding subunit, partial [uncultured Rubellimicrobium sp.]